MWHILRTLNADESTRQPLLAGSLKASIGQEEVTTVTRRDYRHDTDDGAFEEGLLIGYASARNKNTERREERGPSGILAFFCLVFVDFPIVCALWFIPVLTLPAIGDLYLDLLQRGALYNLITVAGLVLAARMYAQGSSYLFGATVGGLLSGSRTIPGRSRPGAGASEETATPGRRWW